MPLFLPYTTSTLTIPTIQNFLKKRQWQDLNLRIQRIIDFKSIALDHSATLSSTLTRSSSLLYLHYTALPTLLYHLSPSLPYPSLYIPLVFFSSHSSPSSCPFSSCPFSFLFFLLSSLLSSFPPLPFLFFSSPSPSRPLALTSLPSLYLSNLQ